MNYSDFIEAAQRALGPMDIQTRERFREMEGLYREWNGKINVVSRRDIDGLYLHHILHSLAIAGYMKANLPEDYASAACTAADGAAQAKGGLPAGPQGKTQEKMQGEMPGEAKREMPSRMQGETPGEMSGEAGSETPSKTRGGTPAGTPRFLDMGTGGGFPGIPLATLFPNASFTLCDSVGKKTKVAGAVADALGLKNVTVVTARAESLTGKYDFVLSRAVAPLDELVRLTWKLCGRGLLCLKGGDVAAETAEMMAKYRRNIGPVHVWDIDKWVNDSWFKEKYVIFVENFCK